MRECQATGLERRSARAAADAALRVGNSIRTRSPPPRETGRLRRCLRARSRSRRRSRGRGRCRPTRGSGTGRGARSGRRRAAARPRARRGRRRRPRARPRRRWRPADTVAVGAGRGVHADVVEEVGDHLAQLVGVGADEQRLVGDLQRPGARRVDACSRRARRRARARSRSTSDVTGVRSSSSSVRSWRSATMRRMRRRLGERAADRAAVLLVVGEGAVEVELQVAADARERRAQLVGGVGDELAQARLGLRSGPPGRRRRWRSSRRARG